MKNKNRLNKLNIRIALAFLILTMAAIGIFAFFTYNFTFRLLENEDTKKTESSIMQASNLISSYLTKLTSFSEIIALHPDIQLALIRGEAASLNSIHSLILLAKESDANIKSISVVSRNGLVITSGNHMAVPISDDMLSQNWYKEALSSFGMPILAPTGHGLIEMDDNDWIVSLYREIKSEDGAHLGIVIIDVSYRFIEDYISNLELGSEGSMYILSQDNVLIYHPDKHFLTKEMSREFIASPELSPGMPPFSTAIEGTDWTMYGSSSFDNLHLLRLNLLRVLILSTAITVLLSVLLSGFLSAYLSRPIRALTEKMMEADTTWEHIPVDPNASFEVAALVGEYNHLIDRIKLLTENIAKKEQDRRLFELRALQSQINPHFLYNTLDTILWLSELGENEEVANVSAALGKILRISLSNEQAFIPLSLEIEHCLSYLNIQKVRYEDMLCFTVEGEKELLSYYVPKLIIQPIVENAIYHGIRGKKDRGNILIAYRKQEENLIIEVTDDGVGFDTQRPEKKDEGRNLSGGIGIRNVHSRIQILCGDTYGLTICSNPGKGTKVIILLPLIKTGDRCLK